MVFECPLSLVLKDRLKSGSESWMHLKHLQL